MRFSGKVTLVTGASGRIGQAIVNKLRDRDAIVITNDRENADICGDLMDQTFCDILPAEIIKTHGQLDILINNAGIITRGQIIEASHEDFTHTMAINVEARFRLCRSAIRIMANVGGCAIVNTAHCWGLHPGRKHPVYVMSKAAIASLTQCLGRNHACQNIRVNAVCPNKVITSMLCTGFAIHGFDPDQAV